MDRGEKAVLAMQSTIIANNKFIAKLKAMIEEYEKVNANLQLEINKALTEDCDPLWLLDNSVESFHTTLKNLMLVYDVSQHTLADGIGISQTTVSKWFTKGVNPSRKTKGRILAYFKVIIAEKAGDTIE